MNGAIETRRIVIELPVASIAPSGGVTRFEILVILAALAVLATLWLA